MTQILLKKTLYTYIWVGIVLYVSLFFYWGLVYPFYNTLNILSFVTYAFLLWICTKCKEKDLTKARLAITVFLYSLIFTGMYMLMSEEYIGNTFMFSEADARKYEDMVMTIVRNDYSLSKSIDFLSRYWNYDDWGAPIMMSIPYRIIASKLSLNFFNIILGTIASVSLFRIGSSIMCRRYAYMASLSYAIGSYMMFYYGSHLKEAIFSFIVIECLYLYFLYFEKRSLSLLLIAVFSTFILFFFRPVVAMFYWVAMVSFFLFGSKGNKMILVLPFVIVAVGIIAYSAFVDVMYNYTHDGDLSSTANYLDTSTFAIITSSLSALLGPFPILCQVNAEFTPSAIYGAGLLFKALLIVPFYMGLIRCFTEKNGKVIFLYVFALLEMLSLAVVNDGFELRKAMPHISFAVLASIWSIYDYENKRILLKRKKSDKIIILFNASVFLWIIVTFAWNTLRY